MRRPRQRPVFTQADRPTEHHCGRSVGPNPSEPTHVSGWAKVFGPSVRSPAPRRARAERTYPGASQQVFALHRSLLVVLADIRLWGQTNLFVRFSPRMI